MNIDPAVKSIGELALEVPAAISVLETWKIDYCCQGGRTIEEACADAGVPVAELLGQIGSGPNASAETDWPSATLASLQQHIVSTHHVFTREVLDTILMLADKVARRHGPNHPEVLEVNDIVVSVYNDLVPHMLKEEQVLFPYVAAVETAVATGEQPPTPFFGTVRNPIAMMMREHETVGETLALLRTKTHDYSLPGDACLSFRALYERLRDLEQDLHLHIHLENNLLFPRAMAMEQSVRPHPAFGASDGKCGCGCSA